MVYLLANISSDIHSLWSFLMSPGFLIPVVILYSIPAGMAASIGWWYDARKSDSGRKFYKTLRCIGWPLFIVFLWLKAFDIISWPWYWIILPIPFVFMSLIGAAIAIVLLFLIILVIGLIIAILMK